MYVYHNVTNSKTKLGLVPFFIICIIYATFSVYEIIVGGIHIVNCQMESIIPVWLVVMGASSLINLFVKIIDTIIRLIKKRRDTAAQKS